MLAHSNRAEVARGDQLIGFQMNGQNQCVRESIQLNVTKFLLILISIINYVQWTLFVIIVINVLFLSSAAILSITYY